MSKIIQLQIYNVDTKEWDILNSRTLEGSEREKQKIQEEIQDMKDSWIQTVFKEHKLRIHTF